MHLLTHVSAPNEFYAVKNSVYDLIKIIYVIYNVN